MAINENARKWVEALRSGEYEQGREYLSVEGTYCCLGVACDLFAKSGGQISITEGRSTNGKSIIEYNTYKQGLPPEVNEWLGLDMTEPSGTAPDNDYYYCGRFFDDEGNENFLIVLNDDGVTFDEIADLIESEPEGLFA